MTMSRTLVVPEHVRNTGPGKRAMKLAKRLDAEAARLAQLQREAAALKEEAERLVAERERKISETTLEFRQEYEARMLKLNDSTVALSGLYKDVVKAQKTMNPEGAECVRWAWQRFTANMPVLALS